MDIHKFYRRHTYRFQRLSLVLLLFFVGLVSAIAQECNSELTVEKNRKYKTVSEEGALFTLLLQNNTNQQTSYTISTAQLEEACGNTSLKSNKPNVPVKVAFPSSTGALATHKTISVEPNAITKFKVLVNAIDTSIINTWGCVEVTATSTNCSTGTKTVLSAWVSDNVE